MKFYTSIIVIGIVFNILAFIYNCYFSQIPGLNKVFIANIALLASGMIAKLSLKKPNKRNINHD